MQQKDRDNHEGKAAGDSTTAFLSIVGCPNVGKSSLLNTMLGQKVAIVSNKPQTTRTRIMGVLTDGACQLVFTDTPGYHRPRTKLGEKMVQAVADSMTGVDACLLVVEPKPGLRPAEEELLQKCKKGRVPVILAINKIDTVADKTELASRIAELQQLYDFSAVVPVCAVKGDGVKDLLSELKKMAQPGLHFFPDDALTDQPERVLAAEMIREKMLRLLQEEVPHGVAVSIERFSEREDRALLDVEAVIYCEKESHKGIIIGKKGAMLKRISTYARQDMERFFDCQVNLQCWVKVKEGWRDREALI
ncbi:MAG TPA: GTPase Era, partial [Clostridiales bacterium]|nr:GTPase Era [Clostridiales bacterium]